MMKKKVFGLPRIETYRKLSSLVIISDMHDVHRILRSRDEHLARRAEHTINKTCEAALLFHRLHEASLVRVPLPWTSSTRPSARGA